jgi:hypothetical protein
MLKIRKRKLPNIGKTSITSRNHSNVGKSTSITPREKDPRWEASVKSKPRYEYILCVCVCVCVFSECVCVCVCV